MCANATYTRSRANANKFTRLSERFATFWFGLRKLFQRRQTLLWSRSSDGAVASKNSSIMGRNFGKLVWMEACIQSPEHIPCARAPECRTVRFIAICQHVNNRKNYQTVMHCLNKRRAGASVPSFLRFQCCSGHRTWVARLTVFCLSGRTMRYAHERTFCLVFCEVWPHSGNAIRPHVCLFVWSGTCITGRTEDFYFLEPTVLTNIMISYWLHNVIIIYWNITDALLRWKWIILIQKLIVTFLRHIAIDRISHVVRKQRSPERTRWMRK